MARPDDEREARLLASRELGRAKRSMQAVRSLYIASAILAGILLCVVLLAGAGPIYIGIYAVVFLVALYGIWGVRSEPFLWTLGAAAYWTLEVGARIVRGMMDEEGILRALRKEGMWFFVICAWALGCWLMLPTTRRVRELLRKHPDLWVSRQIRRGGTRP